ncbi:unnamed protein product [Prorocentrum cordatum]|uniref:Uncharacterized protein n=1 Tax=Prorocentrum cordatum TaxID=2364126 RepID=A0ABN9WQ17_9DINO|nr:unnamed protein product [Polarella glacialis]
MKVGDASAGLWQAAAACSRDGHNSSHCSDSGSRSIHLHRNGLPEESQVNDISEITRTGLRSGGTFVSCGGASTLQQKECRSWLARVAWTRRSMTSARS